MVDTDDLRREGHGTPECRGGAGGAGARKYPDREPGCEHPEVRGAGGVPGHGEKRCEGGLRDRHESPEWEIYAMVNVPEFDLNDPFTLNVESGGLTGRSSRTREIRCGGIAASTIPTSPAPHLRSSQPQQAGGGSVHLDDRFSCPGFRIVEDRKIRCIRSVDMEERHFYREP